MKTYDAFISDEGVEWLGEVPQGVASGGRVRVQITVPEGETGPPAPEAEPGLRINYVRSPAEAPPWTEERRRRLLEILGRLRELNPFAEIEDPVAWQREIRKDRPLPGREP